MTSPLLKTAKCFWEEGTGRWNHESLRKPRSNHSLQHPRFTGEAPGVAQRREATCLRSHSYSRQCQSQTLVSLPSFRHSLPSHQAGSAPATSGDRISSLLPITTSEESGWRAKGQLSRGLKPGSCQPDPLLHSTCLVHPLLLLRPLLRLWVHRGPAKEKQRSDRR